MKLVSSRWVSVAVYCCMRPLFFLSYQESAALFQIHTVDEVSPEELQDVLTEGSEEFGSHFFGFPMSAIVACEVIYAVSGLWSAFRETLLAVS